MSIRVAVVGLGFMGSTHAKAWRQVPHATLAAVVSPDPPLLNAAPGNLPGANQPLDLSGVALLTDLQDVLANPNIDVVDLCLPTYLHADAAVQALEAGKHVFCEKPMALNFTDCQRMMSAARSNGRRLMVGHVLRFWGEYIPLIEAVRSGSLGTLQSLHLQRQCAASAWGGWLRDSSQSGGGVFDLLIHDVDLCIAMLGPPTAVAATGDATCLSGTLHYEDVPSVTITGGWHTSPAFPFSMGYTARFADGTMHYITGGAATLYRTNGEIENLIGNPVDAFEAELSYFAECIAAGRSLERCRMEDSASAVRLIRQLVEATAHRGSLIECEA